LSIEKKLHLKRNKLKGMHALCLLCFVLNISCNSHRKNLVLVIDRLVVDIVKKKREGCRFSRFYLHIKLINFTGKDIPINMSTIDNHCSFNKKAPVFFSLLTSDEHYEIDNIDGIEQIILSSEETKEIIFRLPIQVNSLKIGDIKDNYPSLFMEKFSVCYGLSKELCTVRSDSVEIEYYLDDIDITKQITSFNDIPLIVHPLIPDSIQIKE